MQKVFIQKSTHLFSGFTLVELLVVISIISVLASVIFTSLQGVRDKARAAKAASDGDAFKKAVEFYHDQMGFWPPDTGRGDDPGLVKTLPWRPDNPSFSLPLPACAPGPEYCPSGWNQLVQQKWSGPYLQSWPLTPWGGLYDYNYWPQGATRYPDLLQSGQPCVIPPGIYIGIQGDRNNENRISESMERYLLDQKIDSDGCLDGEAQLILMRL
ncbi:MAG: general secretion pathway protein G [Parcubacteria group bacterium Gr01-1014_33]|nr:MAG: general secretion pathway protein G [Parcubacteria group bacterium Gr01-1014_33]